MKALLINGNIRYTRNLSGQSFGLVENCRHSYLIVLVIISFFIKLSSSSNFSYEEIIKTQLSKVFIKKILRIGGQNEPYRMYDPVNVGLQAKTEEKIKVGK